MQKSLINSMDAVSIIQRELGREVKATITNSLIDIEMNRIREQVSAEIKGLVDKVSFEKIEGYRSNMHFRDEFVLHMKWMGE